MRLLRGYEPQSNHKSTKKIFLAQNQSFFCASYSVKTMSKISAEPEKLSRAVPSSNSNEMKGSGKLRAAITLPLASSCVMASEASRARIVHCDVLGAIVET